MKHDFQLAADYDPKKHPANAIAEIKYDGMMVLAEDGRLYNRDHRDVTYEFPEVQVHPAVVLVGEIVILVEGVSQFHLLQKRKTNNPKEIHLRSMIFPATLVAFDVLSVNGVDYQGQPLSERRKILEDLKGTGLLNGHVYVASYWGCPPEKVDEYLQMMRDQNAEGIIVKDLDAPYRGTGEKSRSSRAWQKLKAWKEAHYDIQKHEITENGGFVIYIANKGYLQKVVVNSRQLADDIAKGNVKRVLIRYLDEEPGTNALRQPHVIGASWDH